MQLLNSSITFQQIKRDLQGFFDWWQTELLTLVPERLRQATRFERERWILALERDQIHAACPDRVDNPFTAHAQEANLEEDSEVRSRIVSELKNRDPERSEIILRLPPTQVLSKVFTLPLMVEENLRQVIGFEMDQQTPFKADQVYYDFEVLKKNPLTQQLTVRLTAVPRKLLDGILERLNTLGIPLDTIDVAETSFAINLLPPERRRPRKPTLQRLNLVLGLVALLLLTATVAIPLIRKAKRAEHLQAEITAVQKEAASVSALRKQLDELTQQASFLVEAKMKAPVVIHVLDALTHLMPDGTWLYQFELNGKEVLMQGESPASSTLIGLLETSPLFRNVTYRSPVTPNRVTGAERFNLSAEVVTGSDS
jgi:general secretion pathway protein L